MSENNKEQVAIIFKSHMYETNEDIDISAKGTHTIKDGKHYVMYTEELEGGVTIDNILKFDEKSLEVSKVGATKTNMYYEVGYTHKDVYRTPFGEFDMSIHTEEYQMEEKSDAYNIDLMYNLELGGAHVSKCNINIQVVNSCLV